MDIVMKKTEELVPYENNPRINDDAVKYVAESIRQFGFKVPIVIDKDDVIIAGHTRLKASKELGIKEVPCIIADDLTEEQVKAFRLADNKVGEKAHWDYGLLSVELEELSLAGFETAELGFIEFETESFIDDLYENKLGETRSENDVFGITFNFPVEEKELILEYVKEVGKEDVVDMIIRMAKDDN